MIRLPSATPLAAIASLAVLMLPAASSANLQASPAPVAVTVTLNNVRADNGPIYVSLQSEAQFMRDEGTGGEIIRTHGGGTVTVTINDVTPGDYALVVWHDNDADGQFDMGSRGPIDGWAMSFDGDVATLRGPPSFAQARVTVDATHRALATALVYPASQ